MLLFRRWGVFACVIVFADLYRASEGSFFRFPVEWRKLLYERQPWYPLQQDPQEFRTFRLMVNDVQFYDAMAAPALAGRLQRLQPDYNMLYGLSLVDGYEEGLLPTVRFKDFMLTYNRNFRNARPDSQLLGLMNVKYIYAELPVALERFREVKLPAEWEGRLPYRLYENVDWRGGVFWLEDLRARYYLKRLDGTYVRMGKLALGFGDTPQLYKTEGAPSEPIDKQEELRLWYYSPNEMHVRKPAEKSGELCVSQATYPGWVAISGETRTPLKRLNAILSSFPAPAGETTVRLRYEPFSFRLGLFLSLAALLALLIFLMGFCV